MMIVRLSHWLFRIKAVPVREVVRGRLVHTNTYRVPTFTEAVTGSVWT